MYIYTIKDNNATLLGQQGRYDQLIEQEMDTNATITIK